MTRSPAERSAAEALSFDGFVREHGQHLFRVSLLIAGNRADAEEAVQEALLRAFRRWDRVIAAENPGAYLRAMVVNQTVSHWRGTGRRELPVAEVHPVGVPNAELDRWSEHEVLWSACRGLPAKLRAAVVLRFYEDLDYSEIADILRCRESAARARVSRGLAKIREQLGEEDS